MSDGDWECATHDWVRIDYAGGVPFRFCTVCDREEYDDGRVRSGWRNFRKLTPLTED